MSDCTKELFRRLSKFPTHKTLNNTQHKTLNNTHHNNNFSSQFILHHLLLFQDFNFAAQIQLQISNIWFNSQIYLQNSISEFSIHTLHSFTFIHPFNSSSQFQRTASISEPPYCRRYRTLRFMRFLTVVGAINWRFNLEFPPKIFNDKNNVHFQFVIKPRQKTKNQLSTELEPETLFRRYKHCIQ
jgi:hypothetical protein